MLFGASALLCLLLQRHGQFYRDYAKHRLCVSRERSRVRSRPTSARSAAALRALLMRRFGARKNRVAEFHSENQKRNL